MNYNYPLSPRSRLVFRGQFTSIDADDYNVDLKSYREGQGSGPVTSFDFTRKSALNRTVGKGTLEYTTRLTQKLTVAALVGYESINRKDYPDEDGLNFEYLRRSVEVPVPQGAALLEPVEISVRENQ